MFSAGAIMAGWSGLYVVRPCREINFVFGQENTLHFYPDCLPFYQDGIKDQQVVVVSNFNSANPIEISAGVGLVFGPAAWLAFWIHAVAVEFYVSSSIHRRTKLYIGSIDISSQLRLTPSESQRLRQVSYERQLERGFKDPGSAGLVAQRVGDANPYVPLSHRHVGSPEGVGMLRKPGNATDDDDAH